MHDEPDHRPVAAASRTPRSADNEIDLARILFSLWRQRWIIVVLAGLGLAYGIYQLQRATYYYTAELKVAAAQSAESGATPRLSGLASLASRAGLGPATTGNTFMFYTQGVASRAVADELARRPDIMHAVFADEWDRESNRYVEPRRGLVGGIVQGVKTLVGFPRLEWSPPGAARLQDYIENAVQVVPDPELPVVTLIYSHPDPRFAELFLGEIHRVLDNSLRRKARNRATEYINYLSSQLQSARNVEHRSAIAQSLSEQEKNRMLASSTMAFAAEPLDVVTSSLRPTSPSPALILLVALLQGIVAGVLVALVRSQWIEHRRPRS